jgi:hypothetical protein
MLVTLSIDERIGARIRRRSAAHLRQILSSFLSNAVMFPEIGLDAPASRTRQRIVGAHRLSRLAEQIEDASGSISIGAELRRAPDTSPLRQPT